MMNTTIPHTPLLPDPSALLEKSRALIYHSKCLQNEAEATYSVIFEYGKQLALFLSITAPLRPLTCRILEEAELYDEIEKTRAAFLAFRETLENELLLMSMKWFTFPPLTPEPIDQKQTDQSLLLSREYFTITQEVSGLKAEWNGLQACCCAKSSPAGIDRLGLALAKDLKWHKEAVLIDFGAGGLLPAYAIISHLSHLNYLDLYLIDPAFDAPITGSCLIDKNGIILLSGQKYGASACASFRKFIRLLSANLGKEQLVQLHVCREAKQAIALLEMRQEAIGRLPHALVAVDPIRSIPYVRAYRELTAHIEKTAQLRHYYCLNEISLRSETRVTAEQILHKTAFIR